MTGFKDEPYLIIGGATKAATTSLFNYLSGHPALCPASAKETRFFLDREYPVKSKYRYEDGIEKYNEYFGACRPGTVRVEATPDYLYSRGTPGKIKAELSDVRFIFILRDPVSRLISWYRFARQNNAIPGEMTFDTYVMKQLDAPDGGAAEQHYLALEQGRYSRYLTAFYDTFGAEKIRILFYEDLIRDPESTVKGLCGFLGIDEHYYDDYEFRVFNRTEAVRNPRLHEMYKKVRFSVRQFTHSKPLIHGLLKRLRMALEPLYLMLNVKEKSGDPVISDILCSRLDKYYNNELETIEKLAGRKGPWQERNG